MAEPSTVEAQKADEAYQMESLSASCCMFATKSFFWSRSRLD